MSTTGSVSLKRVKAAKVDGRAASIRYRQDQLQQLHKHLSSNVDEIREALRRDTTHSTSECNVEISMSLSAVRTHYDSLNFDQSIKDEYRSARGEDFESRRVGVGIVYIRPSRITPLFAVIAPLSTAIAAGNCTVLEVGWSPSRIFSVFDSMFVDFR